MYKVSSWADQLNSIPPESDTDTNVTLGFRAISGAMNSFASNLSFMSFTNSFGTSQGNLLSCGQKQTNYNNKQTKNKGLDKDWTNAGKYNFYEINDPV